MHLKFTSVLIILFCYTPVLLLGQSKSLNLGDQHSFFDLPLVTGAGHQEVYSRTAFLYPEALLEDLESGDRLTQLDLHRFVPNQVPYVDFALDGNTQLRVYIRLQTNNQLSDPFNWNQESSNAQLVYDGSAHDIVTSGSGPKSIPFSEGFVEWDPQEGENLVVMFDFYVEDSQQGSLGWIITDHSQSPALGTGQAFAEMDEGTPPEELEETNFHPFVTLYATDEAQAINVQEVDLGHQVFPINLFNHNDAIATIENTGYEDLENLTVYLETDGATQYSTDTVIDVPAFESATISFQDLPIPEEAGESTVEVYVDEGDVSGTYTVQQQFSSNAFGYVHPSASADINALQFPGSDGYFLNIEQFPQNGIMGGVEVYIPDDASNDGGAIYSVVMDPNGNTLTSSETHNIGSDDLGSFIYLPFEEPVAMEEDQVFFYGAWTEEALPVIPGIESGIPREVAFSYVEGGQIQPIDPSIRLLMNGIMAEEAIHAALHSPTGAACPEPGLTPMEVTLTNNFAEPHENIEITAEIEGEHMDTTLNNTLSDELGPGESETFTLGAFNAIATGDIDVTLIVEDGGLAPEDPATEHVTFFELPDAMFSYDTDADLSYDFTSNDTNLQTYTWIIDGDTVSNEHSFTHTFDEGITEAEVSLVTQDARCTNVHTETVPIVINSLTDGIDAGETTLHVYPNPTRRHIEGTVSNMVEDALTLSLYDLSGRIHHQETIKAINGTSASFKLDTHELQLAKGSYLLRIEGIMHGYELIVVE